MKFFYLLFVFAFFSACSTNDEFSAKESKVQFHKGEYIYRLHDEQLLHIPSATSQAPPTYPWNKNEEGDLLPITKEFFRCKGTHLNPVRIQQEKEEMIRYYDCCGGNKHSLPLRDEKEFIYPILLELLNEIQLKTHKRVVITAGHRCPEHNLYIDSSKENRFSKHMIGAEVSFYVQGLEDKPDEVIKIIMNYYQNLYSDKEFKEFQRYSKEDTNVATQPWYNKEVFLKIFNRKEGRNFDNRHPYPYISIQVRYDRDLKERVIYTWDKAFRNYLRTSV